VNYERVTIKKSQISERAVQIPRNLGFSNMISKKIVSGISGYKKVSDEVVISLTKQIVNER
jgi:hypothetical protein